MRSLAPLVVVVISLGCAPDSEPSDDGAQASTGAHESGSTAPSDGSPTTVAGSESADTSEATSDATSEGESDTGTTPEPSCADGTRWYVAKEGSNKGGTSWASAWNELDQIDWSTIAPGDCIEIGGGTYSTRLVPTAAGTADARIVIERSTEPGHDGKVTFDFTTTEVPDYWAGQVPITTGYLTIDGRDWNQFEWIGGASCLLIVDTMVDEDHFELRNAKIGGHADPGNGGAAVCIFSGSLRLDHVWFGTQVGAEDHIKLVTETSSALDVQHSVFSPWISIDGSHSDLIEQCWPGCEAGDLVFKYNLVWDSGEGGGNLVFTLDPLWSSVDLSYNVFKDTYQVFQFTSRGAQRISNNVFYDVFSTFGGDGDWEAVNNVFVAPPDNSSIVWGSIPRYSLWGPDTYGFFDGEGNVQADPLFQDPEDILGPDGLPFTDDDGFALQDGSPAIDAGTPTVDTMAIGGAPIVGMPDIGAYEHP
jgi:hypothetical protein